MIALVGYTALMWALPIVVAWTPLRDRPLLMALPNLNGTIRSGSATLGWFSPVVFENVEIYDRSGKLLVSAATIRTDKTLLQLALSQTELGTIRIEQPSLDLELRSDGSNAEDVLVPFLKSGNGGGPLTVRLEFVDGKIALHDVAVDRRWKIEQFQTSLELGPKNPVPLECSISGTVVLDAKPAHFAVGYKELGQPAESSGTPSATAAKSAGPASHLAALAAAPVEIQAQVDPLPLAMFRPLVARVLPQAQIAGQLSADLQYRTAAAGPAAKTTLAGQVRIEGLNLTAAAFGADRLQLQLLQIPCQIAWQGRQIDIDQLGVTCDVGQLAITGQTTLPDNLTSRSLGGWLQESFTLQGELDLARLAKLLPNTLHVRQGLQITSGDIKLALTSGTGNGAVKGTGGGAAKSADSGSHRWSGRASGEQYRRHPCRPPNHLGQADQCRFRGPRGHQRSHGG